MPIEYNSSPLTCKLKIYFWNLPGQNWKMDNNVFRRKMLFGLSSENWVYQLLLLFVTFSLLDSDSDSDSDPIGLYESIQ